MASPQFFDFLGTVWELLSADDRQLFGELWHGYEQVLGSVYQQYIELDLNISIATIESYATARWLPYTFDDTTAASATILGFPHVYTLPYDRVVDIPILQDKIRDESITTSLTSGTDFQLDGLGNIGFLVEPPAAMWGRRTLINQETPWYNFGFLMGIYQPNTPQYLSIVQGLWYAYWTGPRPDTVLSSLYLLLDLPTAQESATVTSVTGTEIQTTSAAGFIRTFMIPTGLVSLVAVGDLVTRFQPLVSGINIYDKNNRPGFVTTDVGRHGILPFLTQNANLGPGPDTDETRALTLLEEHTFLPQISVYAFISPQVNLGNLLTFLQTIKPLDSAFFRQIILGEFEDDLILDDDIAWVMDMDITPNVDSNQTTFADPTDLTSYETIDNEALNLDTDVIGLEESVEIQVYQGVTLINDFFA